MKRFQGYTVAHFQKDLIDAISILDKMNEEKETGGT